MDWSKFLSSNVLMVASLLILAPVRRSEVPRHVSTELGLANERNNRTLNTDLQFYDSGNEFFRLCSALTRIERGSQIARDISDARACESYIVGLADGIELQHTLVKVPWRPVQSCILCSV